MTKHHIVQKNTKSIQISEKKRQLKMMHKLSKTPLSGIKTHFNHNHIGCKPRIGVNQDFDFVKSQSPNNVQALTGLSKRKALDALIRGKAA
jgi:hypothetical protein